VLLALPLLVVAVAGLYMAGMSALEGTPRSFLRSLEWAAETLTTTGYGSDSSWSHPLMVLFVVAAQFLGALLVFIVVPIALLPFLERRFEVKLPRRVPPMSGHVVVFHYGAPVATLIDELEKADVPVLVVESRPEVARRLIEEGRRVLAARGTRDALERVHLRSARALIANGTDDQNAAIIVAARQEGFEGEVLALVEEPMHRRPMMLAGASVVFTPRHVLGAALAARASERIAPTVAGIQQLGSKLQTLEVRIQSGSRLSGRTLAEAGIGRETGATVLGQWIGGRLHAPLTGGDRLEAGGILVIAGGSDSLQRVEALCEGATTLRGTGPFIVGGYGEVGAKVVQLLRDVGEEVRVIDRIERPGVDYLGDVLDVALLERLDLPSARAVILALDADTSTLFAALIVKDLAPRVPVIARVNQAENVERIHRAGADFALSLSQVAGQILSRRLLGEEAISFDPQLKLLRSAVGPLVGRSPRDAEIRERTGCSVVAVERGEELLVELDEALRFRDGDVLYVCGSAPEIRRFRDTFGID
jgi:Trk K+ transport system NAD-binding subunit